MEAQYATKARNKKGSVLWQCNCKRCGGEKLLSEDALVHGNYKSCGCGKAEHSRLLPEYKHYYQGTCLEALQCKQRSDSSTGITGVSKTGSGSYKAGITFQGKAYRLGSYKLLKEAATVRKRAEEQLHMSFVKVYSAWLEKRGESREEFILEVTYQNREFLINSNYFPKTLSKHFVLYHGDRIEKVLPQMEVT